MALRIRLIAEFIGTFWLVLGGCGSAVLAAAFPELGIGLLGVALAFGLTVLTMAYAIGHISGCHLNPAVSRRPVRRAGASRPAERAALHRSRRCSAAIVAARACSTSSPAARRASSLAAGFASNGYGEHSPGGYSLPAALVTEIVMTFMFLIDHPRRDRRARAGRLRADRDRPRADADPPDQHPGDQHFGEPRAQHRVRRSSSAVGRSQQLWLFWVAPLAGAVLAGAVYRWSGQAQVRPT